MNSELVRLNIEKDQAHIILNNPDKGNALSLEIINSLINCIELVSDNSSIRFLLIKATGRNFCSGADLNWMKNSLNLSAEENRSEAKTLARLFRLIAEINKITIAYIQGACIGGGIGLAASCDLMICEQDAFFRFSEVKLGLVPATIAPYIVNRIGFQNAKKYMLLGNRISLQEAKAIGLIDFIVNEEMDLSRVVKELESGGKVAQLKIKQLINYLRLAHTDLNKIDEYTSEIIADSRISAEGQEGVKSFLEKRTPNW